MATRQIILDTETTGLDPRSGHRLTEIGCLEMINRRLTGKRFHTYINPERDIDQGAVNITGLTYDFLKDKPKFFEVADAFWTFLREGGKSTELIIHNAPFDLGFLNHELGLINHNIRPIENHVGVIDTLIMARRMHPGQRNNLDVLCKRYNVDNSNREFHGALLDAELLAKVYLAMTAGQTTFALGSEANVNVGSDPKMPQGSNTEIKLTVKQVQRSGAVPLRVIRATEAELQLHQERLLKLEKEKGKAQK